MFHHFPEELLVTERTKKTLFARRPKQGAPRSVPDADLCARFLRGDDNAFVELHYRYASRVASYIEKILGDPSHVRDIFQTTWMKIFRMRERGETIGHFEIVLFRFARNESISFLRKKRESVFEEDFDRASPVEAGTDVEHTELKMLIEEALASVPISMREVFVLKEYQEMSFAQIGDVIGITESFARVRYHRAKHLLRRYIMVKLDLTEGEDPTEFI